jgi:hypothetical protein
VHVSHGSRGHAWFRVAFCPGDRGCAFRRQDQGRNLDWRRLLPSYRAHRPATGKAGAYDPRQYSTTRRSASGAPYCAAHAAARLRSAPSVHTIAWIVKPAFAQTSALSCNSFRYAIASAIPTAEPLPQSLLKGTIATWFHRWPKSGRLCALRIGRQAPTGRPLGGGPGPSRSEAG